MSDTITYTQRAKPLSGDVMFSLEPGRLVFDSGHKVERLRLDQVRVVRFIYAPTNVARHSFRTELIFRDGKHLKISSLTWRSFVDCAQQNDEYRRFVDALVPAIRQASPKAVFVGGRGVIFWWLSMALAGLTSLGLVYFIAKTVMEHATGAGLIGAAVLAMTLWQMVPIIRRNRPRLLAPGEIPADLMP